MDIKPISVEILSLQRALVFSLRFHQKELLIQLPQDLAVQAMNEAFDSCQTKDISGMSGL